MNPPMVEDITLLLNECKTLTESIDENDYPANAFTHVHSALVNILKRFHARRGADLVRLQIYQGMRQKMVIGLMKEICW